MPPTVQELYELWAGDSELRDALQRSLEPRGLDSLFDGFAALGPRPGELVVDVGARDARHAIRLVRDHGLRAIALDPVPHHVELARRAVAEEGVDIEVVEAGIESMPIDDNSADWIWCRDVLVHVDVARGFAECARVLKPGGRLALCDIMLQRPLRFEEVRRLRKPLALLRDVFGDARMEPMSVYESLATAQGLVVEQMTDLTAATRPTFAHWRANAQTHRDAVVALLGEEDLQRFVEACDVLEGFWDDGTLGYGLISASKP